jgi:uncharacterized protein YjbI with pentapeptide repeats
MESSNLSVSFPEQFNEKMSYPFITIPDGTNILSLEKKRVENLEFLQDDLQVNIKVNNCLFTNGSFDINVDKLFINIQNSYFYRCRFQGELFNSDETSSIFINNIFDNCTFNESSNFKDSNFTNSIIVNSSLENIIFIDTDLTNVKFNSVNLTDANFKGAIFNNTIFDNVNLTRIILSDNNYDNNIIINPQTCYVVYNKRYYLYEIDRSIMEDMIRDNIINRSFYRYINEILKRKENALREHGMFSEVMDEKIGKRLGNNDVALSQISSFVDKEYIDKHIKGAMDSRKDNEERKQLQIQTFNKKRYGIKQNNEKTEEMLKTKKQTRNMSFNEKRNIGGKKNRKQKTKKTKKNRKQKTKKNRKR